MKNLNIEKIKSKKAVSHFDFLFGNKNLLKSKRSQIGSTLTWFVAFIVVFFVMLLFIGATVILSKTRGIDVNEPVKYSEGVPESQRALMAFLNTPVEVQGKSIKVKDMILSSLDPYIEYRDYIGKNVVEKIGGNINEIEIHYHEDGIIDVDFFRETGAKEKDKQVREFSKRILDPLCDRYFLKIPQGVISDKGPDFYARRSLSDSDLIPRGQEDKWALWSSIKLPYRGQVVEIKYRKLIKC